jgi:hypothetical protein
VKDQKLDYVLGDDAAGGLHAADQAADTSRIWAGCPSRLEASKPNWLQLTLGAKHH